MPTRKFWDNSSLQGDVQWDNQELSDLTDDELFNTNWNLRWTKSDRTRQKISDAMRGKTLEDLIGQERAAQGRAKRSAFHNGRKRPKEVGEKIAATRRANGSYVNNGMTGHKHKDSTRQQQSTKAQIRQQIKRDLNLGRNDSIPAEILAEAYKKAGLQ